MPSVHDVLRWANRREVAREISRRGYRVSGETLNRWYRQRSEVPAVVERIVFELFGINQEAAQPVWAERLESNMSEVATKLDAFDEWHRRADEREQGRVVEAATQGALEAVRQFLAENDIRPSANGEHDPEPAAEDPQPR